ncbi:uncharacterized protein LOC116777618 [Danaus plexippus]|uniref:uncharacterized protein LOC116777618 n=1 Tax=Danaus plexippus TaxID=13037 RepID=UPI002AB21B84|nr:uncharacterized protein LOC116777618 [Danaus plexippus]
MEEELSENELEEQMYAMIHYVDDTQSNVNSNQNDNNIVENVPQSTVRRYWRTNVDQNTPYQKINTPKDSTNNKETGEKKDDKSKSSDQNTSDLSLFQQPVPSNVKKTVEILENDDDKNIVELETSDEDEVIEVALPPKPTITIESSDEDDVCPVDPEPDIKHKPTKPTQEIKNSVDREVTTSPVPSVVSSISDDFIRGDCIALNISSKHPNNQSFDFSLHGSDLLDQTPSKKKKKKKSKEKNTPSSVTTPLSVSTPVSSKQTAGAVDECFATPKSKAKNKRQRTKSYRVSEKSLPNADVYDSDSNQSLNESNKNQATYEVTDKSVPSTDVYESDSNPSENATESVSKEATNDAESSESTTESPVVEIVKTSKNTDISNKSVVDLTEPAMNTSIDENIVMGNVTGFTNMEEFSDHDVSVKDISKCGSTKIPAILNEDLDFDNLKGSNKVCKRRRYSLTTLRAEMEKFYNESWGGEEFNHREIQKNMSRDKSLWVIDAKDRMPSLTRRKTTCNYCNRAGHRDDACHFKPPVCFMCGDAGHYEPRCPRKICVNCGSPNYVYSTMCRNCSTWKCIKCAECDQSGHPASHCPDVWRRYHDTLSLETPLEENRQTKKNHQMFCSGCTRRGHLVHTCRLSLPFSGLPMNSPYVSVYRPVYQMLDTNNQSNDIGNKKFKNRNNSENSSTIRQDRMKRQSKSPTTHDSHLNKKRNMGTIEVEISSGNKFPTGNQRKVIISEENPNNSSKIITETNINKKSSEVQSTERAPDFIPITSSDNRDKRGQIIQDNEVSDTSEVITSARVYITKEIADLLMTDEGSLWLNTTIKNNDLILENDTITFYLSINGTVGNQEAFQAELGEWIKKKQAGREKERFVSESETDVTQEGTNDQQSLTNNIPKNRNNALRKLNKAFDSLKKDLGDPKTIYKELTYLQNKHQQLINQKVISPKKLSNNRDNINLMLRKLNMVLLGQAGLADGSTHLKELYSLQEKLSNFRQKNIPTSLREEIGEHFHCIFAAIPRDDYIELLSKFYNKPVITFKKKNDRSFKVSPKPNQKTLNPIQNIQRNVSVVKDDTKENNVANDTSQLTAATKNKLVFYHRRLLRSRPMDAVLKKTKSELLRKLHFNLALLGDKAHISSKALKKMRKIQEQAQLFLNNF